MDRLKGMHLYHGSRDLSLLDLLSSFSFSEELTASPHPIAFAAPLTLETISLIFFLYLHDQPFFPLNPGLPAETLKQIVEETRSHFFDPLHNAFLSRCKNPSFITKPSMLTQTSGTSSKPKTAVLSFESLYYSALGSQKFFQLESGDCWQLSLPLFHVGGLMPLFRMLGAKGSLCCAEEKLISIHPKATHCSFVPTQLFRYLQQSNNIPTHLKALLVGGAAADPSLIEASRSKNVPLYLTYGMTETASQITCGLYENGTTLPYRHLEIDPSGEVLVKGATLFQGYLSRDGTLERALTEEGFFATKDIGLYDKKRGLILQGRKDRQFISGGENIQPEEIEKVLKSLFPFSYCKVAPEPCEEYGMIGIAYLDPLPSLPPEEIKRRLKEHLPSYKIPKRYEKASPFLSLKESL